MIPFLKNCAFRIWCAGLLAFVLSLGLLTQTGEAAALGTPLLVFALIYGAVFVSLGWLTNHIVRIQLDPLLHEAGILERGGMGLEAEQAFDKSLTLLDSFLISPRRRRRYLRILGERMARFYAAQAEKNGRAFQWITRYLNAHPEDGAIAEVWLQDMEGLAGWTKTQQDLAARIGEAHSGDRHIQTILARIYISAARTDFPALQTYRRVMTAPEGAPGPMIGELARLFIKEGRADEWALTAYVQAARQGASSPDLLCGLAACLRWIQDAERNRGLVKQARQITGPIGKDELERMSSGFLPPTGRLEPVAGSIQSSARLRAGFGWTADRFRAMGRGLAQGAQKAAVALRSPRLRKVLKAGLIGGLALIAAALIFSTAGHLVKPPPAAAASRSGGCRQNRARPLHPPGGRLSQTRACRSFYQNLEGQGAGCLPG